MNTCPEFDTDATWFIVIIRVFAVISFPTNVFGMFLVICKTPSNLVDYRFILVAQRASAAFLDFTVSTLVQPILFIPLPAAISMGLTRLFSADSHWQAVFCLCAISNTMCTILQMFRFRLQAVAPAGSLLKAKSNYSFVFVMVMSFLFHNGLLIGTASLPSNINLQTQKIELIGNHSCAAAVLNLPNIQMWDDIVITRVYKVLLVQGLCISSASIAMVYLTHSYVKKQPMLSAKTIDLMKQFRIAIVFQSVLPQVLIVVPGMAMQLAIIMQQYGTQLLGLLFILSISIHGCVGTVVMIFLNKPYKDFIKSGYRLKNIRAVNSG